MPLADCRGRPRPGAAAAEAARPGAEDGASPRWRRGEGPGPGPGRQVTGAARGAVGGAGCPRGSSPAWRSPIVRLISHGPGRGLRRGSGLPAQPPLPLGEAASAAGAAPSPAAAGVAVALRGPGGGRSRLPSAAGTGSAPWAPGPGPRLRCPCGGPGGRGSRDPQQSPGWRRGAERVPAGGRARGLCVRLPAALLERLRCCRRARPGLSQGRLPSGAGAAGCPRTWRGRARPQTGSAAPARSAEG